LSLKSFILGKGRNFYDPKIFHKLALTAFFAWVGLGVDGLSSSSYGPEEAFLALHQHTYLSIFVVLGTVATILVISKSYTQIIEAFPMGGGGYVVASKLLSPTLGMISGSALLIDYILTITLSIASGADALFSFLPPSWYEYRLSFAVIVLVIMMIMNLRGVKESVTMLVPLLAIFVITHAIMFLYAFISHASSFPTVATAVGSDIYASQSELGWIGMMIIILRAYSMGAGTFTGIEAVSNGMQILREPRVETAKRTMRYMAVSLSIVVVGLMLSYLLFNVSHTPGKTLNAVLFEKITTEWGGGTWTSWFLYLTLISEAVLLFAAAQTGFLGGPGILANMAMDKWLPSKFSILSDRLVTHNGVYVMGGAAMVLMVMTGGSVKFLVVLYSINVFITFVLSQLGMVRHWWQMRKQDTQWVKKITVNGVGLFFASFILITMAIIKFYEGGWITIIITGSLVGLAMLIKRHYQKTASMLKRLDELVVSATDVSTESVTQTGPEQIPEYNPRAKTAILLVNGFNGLGLHTLLNSIRLFGGVFKNFVFVEIGMIDAGNFKGVAELQHLDSHVKNELDRYVKFIQRHGYYAEAQYAIGTDIVAETSKIAPELLQKYPQAVFFGGQLVFPEETFLTRWLHNYLVFAIQRKFYHQGIPFVILPIRI